MALVPIDVESAQRNGLTDAQTRAWCGRLEAGDILYFPQTPIRLAAEDLSFGNTWLQASMGPRSDNRG